jgi:Ca2+-binding RTX toxin-like protein
MSIDPTLNTLAEQALIACDDSYFTNTLPVSTPGIDPGAAPVFLGAPLLPLVDTNPSDTPQFLTANPNLTAGYTVVQEGVDIPSGGKFIAFQNTSTNNVILAFGGTDGLSSTDWKANLFSYGYNEWTALHNQVFTFLDGLPRDASGNLTVTVNFTGQSLGGALAQYAAYAWLAQDPNRLSSGTIDTDTSHITLTTFNGLGGVYGLQQNGGSNYASILASVSAANFVVQGDIVSQLGGGFADGQIYQLSFPPSQTNIITGEPYSKTMGPIDSHRIESGFYANLLSGGFAQAGLDIQTIAPQSYILPSDQLTNAAALLGNLLNAKGSFVGSDKADLLAGLSVALAFSNPVQLDGLIQAVWKSEYNTGNINTATYTTLNALRFPTNLALKAIGVAATPITLIAAGMSDLFSLGLQGVQTAFSDVQQFLHLDPPLPASETPDEYAMKMLAYLSDVPGSVPASNLLAQEFQTLNVDSDALAQQLLNDESSTWRTDTEAYLRSDLAQGQEFKTVELANAFDTTMQTLPELDSATKTALNQERDNFILQTAEGVANTIAGFTAQYANANYTPGPLSFSDIQQIIAGYGAEINNSNISGVVRVDADQAMALVQSAAEVPVIGQGSAANPFDTPGFNPATQPTPTVTFTQDSAQNLTLSLPFVAGTGGQEIALKLQGSEASDFLVFSSTGELTPDANGVVDVTIPQGDRQLTFSLFAGNNVTANSNLTLSATLLDQNGTPTHTQQLEANVHLTYAPHTNDYPDIGNTYNGGAQGLVNQTSYAYSGPNAYVLVGDGNDKLYGADGADTLNGGPGNDSLYAGTGNDLLLGDWPDGTPQVGTDRGGLDGQDYLVGGPGNDTLEGGGGNDVLIAGTGLTVMYGDYLSRSIADRTFPLVLNPGNDLLIGGPANDTLLGDAGNDTLYGGTGNAVLYGDWWPGVQLPYPTTAGNDLLIAGTGNDQLYGEGGNDTLIGGPGNDTLNGGTGNDVLEGGTGNTTYVFNAGDGQDTIIGAQAPGQTNVIQFGPGITNLNLTEDQTNHTLLIQVNPSDSILLKNFDPNGVYGTSVIQALVAADGTQTSLSSVLPPLDGFVNGASIGNTIVTGPADDVINVGSGNVSVDAGSGNDTVVGGVGNDIIHGGAGDNLLIGGTGNDLFYGEGASDTIVAGTGSDTLIGTGGGNYTFDYAAGSGPAVIDASQGGAYTVQLSGIAPSAVTVGRSGQNVTLNLPGGQSLTLQSFYADPAVEVQFDDGTAWNQFSLPLPGGVITGTNGDDVIVTGATDDLINAEGGNDYIDAGSGNDSVNGGDGNDTIYGGAGNNQLFGGAGDDVIFGEGTNNTIDAGDGNDTIYGGTGNNQLFGGTGNDLIFVQGANDTIDGGAGNDTLIGTGGGTYRYLFGPGGGQDVIDGSQGGNYVVQLSGNLAPSDVAVGRSGRDLTLTLPGGQDTLTFQSFYTNPSYQVEFSNGTVWDKYALHTQAGATQTGTDGPDILTGYPGFPNTLVGGGGDDTYYVNNPTDTIVEAPGGGNDSVYSTANYTLPANVENLTLLETTTGSDGYSTVPLNPVPTVAIGNDLNNVITGNSYDDRLEGGAGDDTLVAGMGIAGTFSTAVDQTLVGGPGNDTYVYNAGFGGIDTIIDDISTGDTNTLITDARAAFQSTPAMYLALQGSTLEMIFTLNNDSVIENTHELLIPGFDPTDAYRATAINQISLDGGQTFMTYQQLIAMGISIQSSGPNELVTGTNADDRITGNPGDTLSGGVGNDTYLFNPGNGAEVIQDVAVPGAMNAIAFGPGITPGDLSFVQGTTTLTINTGTAGDTLTLDQFDPSGVAGSLVAGTLMFAGGLQVSLKDFLTNGNPASNAVIQGTDGPDQILVTGTNDTVLAGAGDDTVLGGSGQAQLSGGDGNDYLAAGSGTSSVDGGAGNDTLYGGSGSDTLVGGSGDDVLVGGSGDTTYVFNRGDGNDIIHAPAGSASRNHLVFGPGISLSDLYLFPTGDGGTISAIEIGTNGDFRNSDIIELPNVEGQAPAVSTATFADGTTVDLIQYYIASQIQTDQVLVSTTPNETLIGGAGSDTLIGGSGTGNSELIGGGGQNTLIGGSGHTTFVSNGLSNDLFISGSGGNTYVINPGSSVTRIIVPNTNVPGMTNNVAFASGYDNFQPRLGVGSLDINYGTSGGELIIEGFDPTNAANNPGIDSFQFTDRTLTYDQLLALGFDLSATGPRQVVNGTSVNDRLSGLPGQDTLIGGAGDDTFTGGPGDVFIGGSGNDTYNFNLGDGQETIQDSATPGAGTRIQFGSGITQADLTFTQGANTLTITVGTAGDALMLDNFNPSNPTGSLIVPTVAFADGTTASLVSLIGPTIINGTPNNDVLYGTSGNDIINGLGGNDYMNGEGGNDALTGGTGNDTLVAGAGQSTLVGGGGNDYLDGTLGSNLLQDSGTGNDTFVINGQDTIQTTNTGTNTAIVNTPGQGVTLNLVASHITNARGNTGNDVLTAAGSTTAVSLTGGGGNDALTGGTGNDTLVAGAGNDTLMGGAGNDYLNGGAGVNVYVMNRGDGQDTIVNDNTTPANSEVEYGGNINPLDLVLSQQANNLRIAIHGSSDQITIQNWYTSSASQVDIIQAGNGQQLLNTQVNQLIQAMAGFTQQTGLTWDQAIDQRPQAVQTVLAASWH